MALCVTLFSSDALVKFKWRAADSSARSAEKDGFRKAIIQLKQFTELTNLYVLEGSETTSNDGCHNLINDVHTHSIVPPL